MTVAELIAQLQLMQQDAPVHFSYNYHDFWDTIVAPAVQQVEVAPVAYSAYHSMDKIDDESSDAKIVVVIS